MPAWIPAAMDPPATPAEVKPRAERPAVAAVERPEIPAPTAAQIRGMGEFGNIILWNCGRVFIGVESLIRGTFLYFWGSVPGV